MSPSLRQKASPLFCTILTYLSKLGSLHGKFQMAICSPYCMRYFSCVLQGYFSQVKIVDLNEIKGLHKLWYSFLISQEKINKFHYFYSTASILSPGNSFPSAALPRLTFATNIPGSPFLVTLAPPINWIPRLVGVLLVVPEDWKKKEKNNNSILSHRKSVSTANLDMLQGGWFQLQLWN